METQQNQEFAETSLEEQNEGQRGRILVDNDFATHLKVDRLVMGGDFTEKEIDEVVDSSQSYQEVQEKLKAILKRKKGSV